MTSIARATCRPTFARTLLARLLLWLALAAGSLATAQAQAPDPASLVGSWRSQLIINGWLGFAIDIAPTGDPAPPLRATGHVGRDRLTASSCAGVPATDRLASGLCEAIEKDGLVPVDVLLAPASGAAGFAGVDAASGATFRFSQRANFALPLVDLEVTRARDDGTLESHTIPPLVAWPDRPRQSDLAGNWMGEIGGLTIEASISAVGADRLAVEFRYFPDGDGTSRGSVLPRLGEVASKLRPFAMIADARPMPGRGRNAAFAAQVRDMPEEWQIGQPHAMQMRLPTNATLEMTVAATREDLVSLRTETILLRPLDRAPREVAPIPNRFEGMSGLWSGTLGPLTVQLDIEVPEDGALKGEIRHFDDEETAGAFPAGVPQGFTWAWEVADKRRPFAAQLSGAPQSGVPLVVGGVDTGDQGDILWTTGFRLANDFGPDGRPAGTLRLDYSVPNQPVAFTGPPIVLTRLEGALRAVETPLPPPPPSGLAGVWTWRSGATDGNVVLLQLDDVDGALEGRVHAFNIGGGCETFARTNVVCELARDHGPFNTAIRLEPTGDTRWTHAGAHGVRAFAQDLPAYADLRLRVAGGQSADQLLVQMTSDAAFGLAPDGTYVFERVTDTGRTNLDAGAEFETRLYEATADDAIGGGACETWAKEDSLLRQRGDAALTAQLDAVLAGQTLSVSGHPMDHQCKTMLDGMAGLSTEAVDPSPTPDPTSPVGPVEQAGAEGDLWRGAFWAFGTGGMNDRLDEFEDLAQMQLVSEAFEARVIADGERLVVSPPGEATRFADEARGAFTIGAFVRDGRSFAESFDSVFDTMKGASVRMPDASTQFRLPYPDGPQVRDYVGDDATLWLRRLMFAYVSADGRRVFIGHEANFGEYRYLLLSRDDAAAPPAPPAEAGGDDLAGTWTRLGEPIYAVTHMDLYRPEPAAAGTVDRFEIRASADGHDFVVDGTRSTPLREAGFPASAVASLLAKSAPQTGGGTVAAWLGSDPTPYMAHRGGGDRLFWGEAADPTFETDVLLLVSGARAVAIIGSRQRSGLIELETFGNAPGIAVVLLFERTGAPAPGPVATIDPPDGRPAPDPVQNPAQAPTDPAFAEANRSPVCVALWRREAEILSVADTGTVQLVRSIVTDAGLAFGGEETDAKCQRALDQLAGLSMALPRTTPLPDGDTTIVNTTDVNTTSVVSTVVDTLNVFVEGGGSFDAPGAPDACRALTPIARGLSIGGGLELSGALGDLFVSFDITSFDEAAQVDCYRTLAVLDDYGLDPGNADNMGVVVSLIDTLAPPRAPPGGLPVSTGSQRSRACEAFDAYSSALLERADTPLVQFLRGHLIENGYGMISGLEPDAAACSRMLRELVELGLDPALPDGGWSRAAVLLGAAPVEGNRFVPWDGESDLQPTDGYDPRPEAVTESIVLRPDFGYVVAEPPPLGLRRVDADARVVAFIVPDDAVLGLVAAPENAPGYCNEGRLLSTLDGFRGYASMRELMRHLGAPPAMIHAGRDCALVETAGELAAASFDDPAFSEGDVPARAQFDRRLDGYALSDAARPIAAGAVRTLATGLDHTGGAWHVLVTTPEIVEATTGLRPRPGGVVVVDARDGAILAEFRMRHGAETP